MESDFVVLSSCKKKQLFKVVWRKHFLITMFLCIKYHICIKESSITKIVSVLFGRSSPYGNLLHSGGESTELRVEGPSHWLQLFSIVTCIKVLGFVFYKNIEYYYY